MMNSLPPGLILIIGAPLLALCRGRVRQIFSLILPILTLISVMTLPVDSSLTIPFLEYQLELMQVGPYTRVFATIFALMACGGALFALNQKRQFELPAAYIYAGSALGVAYAGDWFTMFIFWELMAIGSTIVVWCGADSRGQGDEIDESIVKKVGETGLRYLAVHLVGGVLLMVGIVGHVMETGDTAFDLVNLGGVSSWLILIGMLVNAGVPFLGAWLPDAYPAASVSGSVFLSAYTTKTAVFTLMVAFRGTELLIYVGLIMAVFGIVYAILENDMRRILSYSIINQVGFMICGIGIGTDTAINGACGHAFAHIIYKALLLMSAGSVLYMTGKRRCTDLGGLYRTMPVTMWCGIIGALAISAFPLTSGFVTKSMISDAAATGHHTLAWFVLTAASAGVFLHAGIKFPWFVFFQKDSGLRAADPPLNMRLAMLILSALCIGIGVYPEPLYGLLPHQPQEGVVLYQAYTFGHVLFQLQLLLFAGLAFFALLPLLKRTNTLVVDSDWIYRKLAPAIWRSVISPPLRGLGRCQEAVFRAVSRRMAGDSSGTMVLKWLTKQWLIDQSVVLITFMLLVFLLFNFLKD